MSKLEAEKELWRYRRGKFTRFAVLGLIILLVVVAVVVHENLRVYSDIAAKIERELTYTEHSSSEKLEENTIIYNLDGMRCVDQGGETLWDVVYQMQQPTVDVDGNKVAVGDVKGDIIYLMDDEGPMGEIKTNLPIVQIAVAEAGIVAAILEDVDVYWIYVYNHQGETLLSIRTTMEQSGYPMSISLSPNGVLFSVSFLHLNGGELKTSVAFYNFGEVGQNYVDRYTSGYNYTDLIVPNINFMSNDRVVAIADSRIMFYKGAEKPELAKEVLLNHQIEFVYEGEEHIALAFRGISPEGDYTIQVYDLNGNLVLEQHTDFPFTKMICENQILTLYHNAECEIWTFDGRMKYSGSLGYNVLDMYATDKKYEYNIITNESFVVIGVE